MPRGKRNLEKQAIVNFLPERMKKARQDLGLKQKDLADLMKFHPSTISALENYTTGKKTPNQRTILSLSRVLGRKPNYFTDITVTEETALLPANEAGANQLEITNQVDELEVARALGFCRDLVRGYKYEEAWQEIQQLLLKANPQQKTLLNFLEAKILSRQKQKKEVLAREILTRLQLKLEIGEEVHPDLRLADIFYELGSSYRMEELYELAGQHYERALEELGAKADEDILGLWLYIELGYIYKLKNERWQAMHCYDLALKHPEIQRDRRIRAIMLQDQAIRLKEDGKLAESQRKLAESIEIFNELELFEQASTVSSFLDVLRAETNQPDKIKLDMSEEQISKLTPANQIVVRINRLIALRLKAKIEEDTALLDRAVIELENAHSYLRRTSDDGTTSQIAGYRFAELYLEQGQLYRDKKQFNDANASFEQALVFLRQLKTPWTFFQTIYDAYLQTLLESNIVGEKFQNVVKMQYYDKNQFS